MKKGFVFIGLIFFSLTGLFLVSASNLFEETFSRFDLGVFGFLLSLFPAVFLLFLTYLSYKKASRILIAVQLLLWYAFTIYVCLRAWAFLDSYYRIGFMPGEAINFFTTYNVPTNDNEYYWYQLSIYANAIIGLIMSFGNKNFRKIFMKY